jgi:DNA-binding MarR family transcriptional regulator
MSGLDSPSGQYWRADQPSHPLGSDRSAEFSSDEHPSPQSERLPAEQLIDQIQRAAQILKNRLAEHFQTFGLNEIRYSVIRMVHEAAPHGCSQTDLADALDQSESSISTLVERMRTDNLIYRLRSKLDRRKRVLILTERGQSILQQIEQCHAERLEQMMKNFGPEQRLRLSQLLDELLSHLDVKSPSDPPETAAQVKPPHLLQTRSETASPPGETT